MAVKALSRFQGSLPVNEVIYPNIAAIITIRYCVHSFSAFIINHIKTSAQNKQVRNQTGLQYGSHSVFPLDRTIPNRYFPILLVKSFDAPYCRNASGIPSRSKHIKQILKYGIIYELNFFFTKSTKAMFLFRSTFQHSPLTIKNSGMWNMYI